jgi:CheY-like chemotaxis protein
MHGGYIGATSEGLFNLSFQIMKDCFCYAILKLIKQNKQIKGLEKGSTFFFELPCYADATRVPQFNDSTKLVQKRKSTIQNSLNLDYKHSYNFDNNFRMNTKDMDLKKINEINRTNEEANSSEEKNVDYYKSIYNTKSNKYKNNNNDNKNNVINNNNNNNISNNNNINNNKNNHNNNNNNYNNKIKKNSGDDIEKNMDNTNNNKNNSILFNPTMRRANSYRAPVATNNEALYSNGVLLYSQEAIEEKVDYRKLFPLQKNTSLLTVSPKNAKKDTMFNFRKNSFFKLNTRKVFVKEKSTVLQLSDVYDFEHENQDEHNNISMRQFIFAKKKNNNIANMLQHKEESISSDIENSFNDDSNGVLDDVVVEKNNSNKNNKISYSPQEKFQDSKSSSLTLSGQYNHDNIVNKSTTTNDNYNTVKNSSIVNYNNNGDVKMFNSSIQKRGLQSFRGRGESEEDASKLNNNSRTKSILSTSDLSFMRKDFSINSNNSVSIQTLNDENNGENSITNRYADEVRKFVDHPRDRFESVNSMESSSAVENVYGTLKILIVDDAPLIRKMLERSTFAMCKECHHANNGAEAIKKTLESIEKNDPYDVIIMDYYMPGMNGPEAIKIIREQGFKNLIIGATGSTSMEDNENLMESGADFVMLKPLKLNDFKRVFEEKKKLKTINNNYSNKNKKNYFI